LCECRAIARINEKRIMVYRSPQQSAALFDASAVVFFEQPRRGHAERAKEEVWGLSALS
jgi:hypothetical protein